MRMADLAPVERRGLRSRGEHSLDLLSFVLADEAYAVDLGKVQEIVVPPPITSVPRAARSVIGVCSVRGQLVTVLDLRTCLGLPAGDPTRRRRILLGRTDEDEVMGLLVDEVKQVVRLLPSELELSTSSASSELSEFVRGIGRPSGGEVLVLLDMHTILMRGGA